MNIGAPYLQLAGLVERNGGFTIQLVDDIGIKVITSGYAVSDRKDLEATFKYPADYAANIRDYVATNGKILRDGRHCLGAWVDNGTLYLDVVRVFKAAHHARKCAIEHNQIAYFCLDTFEELRA